jgi:hypothetical protein
MSRLESPCASSLVDVHLIRTGTATVFIVVGLEEDDLTAFRLGEARLDGAGNEDSVTGLKPPPRFCRRWLSEPRERS